LTQTDAIKRLLQKYFYITDKGEIDWRLSETFTLDRVDPELAGKLSEYLSWEQKRDRKMALKMQREGVIA